MIAAAKSDKLPLSIETCPHYLYFSAEEISEGATSFKCAPPIRTSDNRQLAVLLGEVAGDPGGRHRIRRNGNRGRSGERIVQRFEFRAFQRDLHQPVLGDMKARPLGAHVAPKFRDFPYRQAALMGHDQQGRFRQRLLQFGYECFFTRSVHAKVSDQLAVPCRGSGRFQDRYGKPRRIRGSCPRGSSRPGQRPD